MTNSTTKGKAEDKPRKKRERHVFPTDEVAHIWARQTQSDGRNACNNVYFHNETIYSYGQHFPIATFVDAKVVLFTTRTYSSTTAGHVSGVRGAIPPDVTVIKCDNIRANSTPAHQDNLKELWKDLTELCEQHARAVKLDYRERIATKLINIDRYAKWSHVGRTKRLATLIESRGSVQLWGLVLGMSPEAARDVDAKKHARREADERRDREKNERRRAAREAEVALVGPAAEAAWRAGHYSFVVAEPDGIGNRLISVSSCVYSLPTMLRLNHDKSIVETSRGARIKVETAKRIWPVLKRRGTPDETIEGYRPIGWHTSDDTLQIGCHRIPYTEMERLAVELELEPKLEEVLA